ncbi:hypothetical protein E4K68_17030 [Desulfosporosinus sp. Sb-LF]|nr:hypothetical protein E4K68_17030 [Desulfosporosinus sp. Sb-LF]
MYIKLGIRIPVYKFLETINRRDSLLQEFDEEIFNALVEKIESLTPAHFVFELKSGRGEMCKKNQDRRCLRNG